VKTPPTKDQAGLNNKIAEKGDGESFRPSGGPLSGAWPSQGVNLLVAVSWGIFLT